VRHENPLLNPSPSGRRELRQSVTDSGWVARTARETELGFLSLKFLCANMFVLTRSQPLLLLSNIPTGTFPLGPNYVLHRKSVHESPGHPSERCHSHGFTLIEPLVVIVIIALLLPAVHEAQSLASVFWPLPVISPSSSARLMVFLSSSNASKRLYIRERVSARRPYSGGACSDGDG
jgi:prepilin-type N-terminal cleavage/methylation domain-containing protein